MAAALLSPRRIKKNRLRWRRCASARTVYAYVYGNPILFVDPLGLEGVGEWTYPPGPYRDSYNAARNGEIALNFQVSLVGSYGMTFGLSGSPVGLGIDTKGNVCFTQQICGTAPPMGVLLGGSGGVNFQCGTGELKDGSSQSVQAGLGISTPLGGKVYGEMSEGGGNYAVGAAFVAGEQINAAVFVCKTVTRCL